MAQKVVAHFLDGLIVKGTSADIDPGKPRCHVHTVDRQVVEIDLATLKALYLVKDLTGRPGYQEAQVPDPADVRLRGSHQVELSFADGESLSGLMNAFPPIRQFFWVLPIDPKSNNIRILVNREALVSILSSDGASAVA
jgi:hypothetical protein